MLCEISWENSGVYEKTMKTVFYNQKEIKYKLIRKAIKHMYLRIRKDYVEVSASYLIPEKNVEEFILKYADEILKKIETKKENYLFGKKVLVAGEEIYKEKLPPVVLEYVKKYSSKMNLYPSKVSFRFNKTRWGSCSAKNNLTFNYYLAKLPYELIEYVVVHELAHIKHKNHSREFWAEVEKYLPDVKKRRKLLRSYEKII